MTQAPEDGDGMLKVTQACRKLGLSRRKLMELIASGDIATVRIPSKNGGVREHRIEPEEIERFKDLYRQRGAA
jgi:excisionase family DNA binding protein